MHKILLATLMSLSLLAIQSDDVTVIEGTVANVSSRWEVTEYGDRIIVSRLTLDIRKVHRGRRVDFVDVPGGTLDGVSLRVSSLPILKKGDRAIFKLDKNGKLDRKQGPAITGVGQAFTPNIHKWPVNQIDYYVNPNNGDGMDFGQVIAAIQRAADVWSTQSSVNFKMRYAGPTAGGSFQYDQRNEVFFRADSPPAVAEAYSWYAGSTTLDVDIAYYDGGATFFATQQCNNGYYVEDTGVHEFGHMLGLMHSDVPTATMWPYSPACTTDLRTLDPDDVAGAEFLYPPTMEPLPPPPPPPPSPIVLTAFGYKQKSTAYADLKWSGATTAHVVVKRNGVQYATTANDGAETFNLGKGGTAYNWQVCELASSICSAVVAAQPLKR